MNKKITYFYHFFIENIKMVCYNHISVRHIWRAKTVRVRWRRVTAPLSKPCDRVCICLL